MSAIGTLLILLALALLFYWAPPWRRNAREQHLPVASAALRLPHELQCQHEIRVPVRLTLTNEHVADICGICKRQLPPAERPLPEPRRLDSSERPTWPDPDTCGCRYHNDGTWITCWQHAGPCKDCLYGCARRNGQIEIYTAAPCGRHE